MFNLKHKTLNKVNQNKNYNYWSRGQTLTARESGERERQRAEHWRRDALKYRQLFAVIAEKRFLN